jgi:cytochrome d ubiquinol oxidase subunit I
MELDPLLLSRIQFAFVVSFHIIFPSFTIGLASWLVVLEALWLRTGEARYMSLYRFWLKIFAVAFGLGVVSGIVMSYQFGTNWSAFSIATGSILGPLLSYEVLTAFFLEAGFLGVMLFGWKRVSPAIHFGATVLVAAGTLISTFWIISANSWMHTPQGFELRNGVFQPVDWWAIIFNPSFPYRLVHMVLAAYLTTAFVAVGVAAWYLVAGRFTDLARTMMNMGLGLIAVVAPLQILAGDLHGLNVRDYQPAKLAAIEAHWETQKRAPLILFALPDPAAETNRYEISIPGLGSLILTHDLNGEVRGLKEWAPQDRPPVRIVFWSFRIMVGIGIAMLLIAFTGLYLGLRGRLYDTRWFLQVCRLASPLGFIAILAGWITAEVGRQPYVVYGLMRTADGVSPVAGGAVGLSLLLFGTAYLLVFAAGAFYIQQLLGKGPGDLDGVKNAPSGMRAARPLSAAGDRMGPDQ